MSEDRRNVLQVLCYELNFIEQGGYDRVREPASPFLSTLSCLNFDKALRSHACHECLLFEFVPPESHAKDVPCHHIRLNDDGDTIATLLAEGERTRLYEAMAEWLRSTIKRIESETLENSVSR